MISIEALANDKKVYDVEDIQKLLGIGRSKAYTYLDEVYQKQEPFRVIKIGKLFRVGSAETYDTYRGIVYNHIIPHWGKRKVADINRGKNRCSWLRLYFFLYPCYTLRDWKKSKRDGREHLLLPGHAAKNQRF